jgi:mono/diheme cytochrome c family protein
MINPTPLRWLVLALIFTVALVGGWFILTTPGLKPVVISVYEPAIIHPSEVTHDLGNILTDSQAVHTFQLYNVGGKKLQIDKVDTSCGCTVVDISKKSIPPGGFTSLKVTLDTSIKLGRVKKTISVFSNDPNQPVLKLYLKGNVLPNMKGHEKIAVKDPLVLFKGQCATCHVMRGKGKTGKALFQADCAMCHGMNGEGAVAMPVIHANYEDPKQQARVRKIIAEGSPRTPEMPPFAQSHGGPLTESEIDSLVTFLKFQSTLAKQGLLEKANEEEEEE